MMALSWRGGADEGRVDAGSFDATMSTGEKTVRRAEVG